MLWFLWGNFPFWNFSKNVSRILRRVNFEVFAPEGFDMLIWVSCVFLTVYIRVCPWFSGSCLKDVWYITCGHAVQDLSLTVSSRMGRSLLRELLNCFDCASQFCNQSKDIISCLSFFGGPWSLLNLYFQYFSMKELWKDTVLGGHWSSKDLWIGTWNGSSCGSCWTTGGKRRGME